jgi:bifunctional non-homologous end joining protein LigD
VLGLPGAGALRYVGHVGTGFADRDLDELLALLGPIETDRSPFDGPVPDQRAVHFVRPVHVGEVRFRAWSDDGHLRHPSWRGLRPDRAPDELRRTPPDPA